MTIMKTMVLTINDNDDTKHKKKDPWKKEGEIEVLIITSKSNKITFLFIEWHCKLPYFQAQASPKYFSM